MKHTQSAGGVVVNKNGQILVVNQNGNSWSLPKGHLEQGETALEAAQREIYEESGIKSLVFLRELGSYDRHRIGLNGGEDVSELKTISLFLFQTECEHLNPLDPVHLEARWVEKERVADLLTHPLDKKFWRGHCLNLLSI